jgi:hypothetical protein
MAHYMGLVDSRADGPVADNHVKILLTVSLAAAFVAKLEADLYLFLPLPLKSWDAD